MFIIWIHVETKLNPQFEWDLHEGQCMQVTTYALWWWVYNYILTGRAFVFAREVFVFLMETVSLWHFDNDLVMIMFIFMQIELYQ